MQRLSGRREAPSGPIFCRRSFPVKNRFRGPAGPNPFFCPESDAAGHAGFRAAHGPISCGGYSSLRVRSCRRRHRSDFVERIESGRLVCFFVSGFPFVRSQGVPICFYVLSHYCVQLIRMIFSVRTFPRSRVCGRVRKSGGSRSRTAADKKTGTGATCG